MSIAIRTAADTTCGITEAQRAAAFDVAGLSPELRAVQGRKQSSAAHLPRYRGKRILRASRARGGVLRGVGHARTRAAIGVAHQHAPKLVNRDVIKIEQVPAGIAAALIPNAAALHGVGRGRIPGGPSPATVVRDSAI